jgi:hypothetical protein
MDGVCINNVCMVAQLVLTADLGETVWENVSVLMTQHVRRTRVTVLAPVLRVGLVTSAKHVRTNAL